MTRIVHQIRTTFQGDIALETPNGAMQEIAAKPSMAWVGQLRNDPALSGKDSCIKDFLGEFFVKNDLKILIYIG